jgi:hypothetical protein
MVADTKEKQSKSVQQESKIAKNRSQTRKEERILILFFNF